MSGWTKTHQLRDSSIRVVKAEGRRVGPRGDLKTEHGCYLAGRTFMTPTTTPSESSSWKGRGEFPTIDYGSISHSTVDPARWDGQSPISDSTCMIGR
jgi:hypothetical protein